MSIRLNVPFKEKDTAKAYGARWNAQGKFWFYPGDELPDELRRWSTDDETEVVTPLINIDIETNNNNISGKSTLKEDSSLDNTINGITYSTVTQINTMIKSTFSVLPEFNSIKAIGEVTNFNGISKGYYYFSIKDQYSLLPCVISSYDAAHAINFELVNGMQVAIEGKIDYYEKTGKSQLRVLRIIDAGAGAARLAYEQLKEKLRAEGLFDIEHKKPIPKHPKRVGIVTSKDGQAIKDIEKVSKKRNPFIELILYPVSVQGVNAVKTTIDGIKALDAMNLDVIIVGRGGGSDEELSAYNDEGIARAVYNANTPIISAVGHQGHFTLIDEVSDLRVATPSEAAETVCPDIMADINKVISLSDSMKRTMDSILNQKKLLLNARITELEKNNPERKLKEQKDKIEKIRQNLDNNMQNVFNSKKHSFEVLVTRLHGLSPTAKLVNGFGYISYNGAPLASVKSVKAEDEIRITLHDGQINAKVESVNEKNI